MSQDPFINKKIPGYQIESRISSGIYKAKEDFTNRTVRIKIVKKSEDHEVQKMVDLATTLATLHSSAIPQFYTMTEDDTYYYMALELLQGKSLHQCLQEGRKFSLEEIFHMVIALAEGLDKGHRLGVVHQNLYPKTIAVGENNIVKMITYGLNLKIGKTGFDVEDVAKEKFVQGTDITVDEEGFYYWSPELYNDCPLDARSDIYSLGVIFYHLATGKYPLGDYSGIGYLNRLAAESPNSSREHNPSIPKEVDAILMKMLQPQAQERYQTAGEVEQAMRSYMQQRNNDIRFEDKEYLAKAFVAMPFAEKFDPVFEIIEAACEDCNVQAIRVDNLVDIDNIWYAILREIGDCEFVIADFSGDKYEDVANSNVVTEAAHARAIGKPVILLSQKPQYMFFDWRTQHAIAYNLESKSLQAMKKSLMRKIQGCIKLVQELHANDRGGSWIC